MAYPHMGRNEQEYAKLRSALYKVLKDKLENQQLVSEWLDTPNFLLGHIAPMDYMRHGDLFSLEQVMYLAENLKAVPGVGWQR